MTDDPRDELLLRAIGALTAWADAPDDAQRFPLLDRDVAEVAHDYESAMELIVGLGNLAVLLLIRLERITGALPTDTLQDLAERGHEAR